MSKSNLRVRIHIALQPWAKAFRKNCKKNSIRIVERNGKVLKYWKYGERAISMAFLFANTPQGYKFWDDVDRKFRRWFNS